MKTTIKDAATLWVQRDMIPIPISVVEKLSAYSDYNDFAEITPVSTYANVWSNSQQESGEVVKIYENEDGDEVILVDFNGDQIECNRYDLSREEHEALPMWGTMWCFADPLDKEWIEHEENMTKMAECGFRLYESEDYGIVFGIDGAGYDFYESHWVPLYKARGLRWHDTDE